MERDASNFSIELRRDSNQKINNCKEPAQIWFELFGKLPKLNNWYQIWIKYIKAFSQLRINHQRSCKLKLKSQRKKATYNEHDTWREKEK